MTKPVFIIAEAGVNHNGSLEIAKKMIDAAAKAGVDAVKFQTFRSELLATDEAEKAAYQSTCQNGESQKEMLKKLELSEAVHVELFNYASERDLVFMSTPFDHESIDLLNRLGLKIFKIGSGDMTNVPYLRKIAGLGKKIIMSTGMSDLDEIGRSLQVLLDAGMTKKNICLLHTNTDYPTSYSDVNLRAMLTIGKQFDLDTGYSDHTRGIEVPVAATALGARVIEKHFTLGREMEGPDHKASLEPDELKAMVKAIRNIEMAMGNGEKVPTANEMRNFNAARKSLVAAEQIKKGELFTEDNIAVKRPGNGISPLEWDSIIGTPAHKDYKKDDLI